MASSKLRITRGSSSRRTLARRSRTRGARGSSRPSSFSPKPMWRRSSFTMPSRTSRVRGSASWAWRWKTENSIASRITFWANSAASQSSPRTSSWWRRRNSRRPGLARRSISRSGSRDAELEQAVDEDLEMARLVHRLRRQEHLRGPIRSDADQGARALERDRLADAVVAQRRDQPVALAGVGARSRERRGAARSSSPRGSPAPIRTRTRRSARAPRAPGDRAGGRPRCVSDTATPVGAASGSRGRRGPGAA